MNTATVEKSILIIEDESSLLDVLSDEFASAGFTVIRAADGETGLKQAKDKHPDVVLLDLKMPNMSGHEVLKALSAAEWGASIPVIVATNSTSTADINQCLQAGVYDYFIKSDVSLKKLVSHVQQKIDSAGEPTAD